MFTLLRNGSPTPACKQCRRFFDDDRGHSPGCRFGPTGVAMPEHHWGYALVVKKPHETLTGAPDTFEKCPRKWSYPKGETLLDKLNANLDPESVKRALAEGDIKVTSGALLWQEIQHGDAMYRVILAYGWAYKKLGRNYGVHKLVVKASGDFLMSPPLRVKNTEQEALDYIAGRVSEQRSYAMEYARRDKGRNNIYGNDKT